jgi:membrane-associated protease RseP (regulator of RpoE activity)
LPPLDGGHAAVAIYERIRSRRGRRYHADMAKLLPLTYAVVLGLVMLGVASLYLDIVNPIDV